MPANRPKSEPKIDDAEPHENPERNASSAGRVLALLDLFTLEHPKWTVDMIQQHFKLKRATAYRYARELASAGFIVPASGGGYVLGPRIVEFDRQIRLTDPLLREAPEVMQDIRGVVNGAILLCAFYGNRVLTVHQEKLDEKIEMSMERGRPFPLFRGAPSRVILAHLSSQQMKDIYLAHSQTIAAEGLGQNWDDFKASMKAIHKKGYYVGSEIDPALVGVAAPIFLSPRTVLGCLCVVRRSAVVTPADISELAKVAIDAAQRISKRLSDS
jgi:DNA-binding IclR family transcriptional regulator